MKPQAKWGAILLLSGLLLGVFAYFGLKYYRGEASAFPLFRGAAAWVEGTVGEAFGGGA